MSPYVSQTPIIYRYLIAFKALHFLKKAFESVDAKKIEPGIAIDFGPGYDGVKIAYLLR
jgi:hypothetical protein